MEIKVIITGATGFVGEGVLLECLAHPLVSEVLMVNRKHFDLQHPKLNECIVPDFTNLEAVRPQLKGYDACFYCAGISSNGLDEAAYLHITYDLTIHFAEILAELNPDMAFNFISGSHTDSTEKGRVMWARVKGKTENALQEIGFKKQFNFRPAVMKPTPGQQNVKGIFKVINFLFPLLRKLFPSRTSTLQEVGTAMINSVFRGYPYPVLEVTDIKELAKVNVAALKPHQE